MVEDAQRRPTASVLLTAALALFVAGEAVLLVAVGRDALWLVAGWALAALAIAGAARVVSPTIRLVGAAVLVPTCVLFTGEGGLFFVPAALALAAAALLGRSAGTARA
jgi:hypothetical protein